MGIRMHAALALTIVFAVSICTSAVAATGRTPGQFAVSPSGAATYSIPIKVPPGPRGMQPSLSLAYSSQSGIGPLGVGWSIGGLGAVARCNLTYAQDAAPAPVALVTGDGYCINGNRLRLTAGTYGEAGSTYQTEIADFSNVTMNGTAGNGPGYFTVQAKNGLTYYYGYTDSNGNGANSQVLATGSTTANYWLLSKVIDRAGNNYVINYTSVSGTSVVAKILWTPTSAGAASYTYSMVFNYTTNEPQSSITKYVSGTLVANTELLSSVAIYNGSTVIKDYFLGYQASPTTGREELIKVTECADSAESNCLLPTTIGYQAGGLGVSSTSTTALSSTGSSLTARYDLNGDGYPDLVYANSSGTCYVSFGSASGYGSPVAIGVCPTLIGNLTGGSSADGILAVVSGTWWYYTWSSATSKFTGVSTGLAYDTTAQQFQLADVNGDGLPDLVSLNITTTTIKTGESNVTVSSATVYTRLNTGAGGTPTFSSTLNTAYSAGSVKAAELQTPDMQYGKLRRYDFNGDGRDDLVLMTVTGTSPNFTQNTYELLSTGATSSATEIQSVSASTYSPVFFTNWNNDACTDFVTTAAQPNSLYISGCNGTVAMTYSVGTVVAAMDWDGDGRTDLVVANGTTLGVYLSTGVAPSSTVLSTAIPYTSTCQYVTMDANADGLDDLGCWSQSGGSSLTYYLHNGAEQPPDLATSFVDGYGNSVSPKYAPIAQPNVAYNAWNDQVYPNENWIGPLYVTYYVTFSDPSSASGGTYLQQYWYAGAAMSLTGRGFLGFGNVEQFDSRNGIWQTWGYGRVFPYTGMLTGHWGTENNSSADPVFNTQNTTAVTTLDSTAWNERYFPYISNYVHYAYEIGGTKNFDLITNSSTNYTYDNYGNVTTIATTVTDEDSQSPVSPNNGNTWTSKTVSTITADTSTWCLGLPTEVQVTNSSTATGGTAITRTVNYTPDYTNCRETQKVVAPGTSYQVTEAYGFDSFGNLSSDTVTGTGMTARTTGTTWGTTGQFPTVITNALGQTITLGHDPNTGFLTSQTDPNYTSANPLQITWTPDAFGRKIKEVRADGTSTTWSYNPCTSCDPLPHMDVTQQVLDTGSHVITTSNLYFDALDRQIYHQDTLLSGAATWSSIRYFDSLGRVVKVPFPYLVGGSPPGYETTSYDVLNRPIQSQRPISATNSTLQTTTFGYAGRTSTVKDPLGNTTTKISLVTGPLARSQDPAGYYQNFTYDAFGALTAVKDSASNALFSASYAYGVQAFQTAATDMDLGARSYTVDPLGEVTGWTDAKSQSFSMTYDALSRPLVRTEPDLTTTWTWGSTAASYNIGKLASVTAAGSSGTWSDTDTYDSLGRPSTEVISNPGDRTYTYAWTYDPHSGLLASLQYPVDISFILTLQYAYTNGILSSISSNSFSPAVTYWTANATNPRGQVTQETLGNGVVINRNFDAVTGWLGSVQAGASGGSGLQNNSFLYDYDGNVTQREDNNQGLTENFYYDADNRFSYSTLGGATNLQVAYDTTGMGNIVGRSDVAGGAAWTYDPVRKHAVTQAGSSAYTYTYDANGNAITRNGSAITWSSYNYPTSVSTASESVDFYYGGDRQRWKEVYTNANGTETTYHAGKLFEVAYYLDGGTVLAHYRHYVYAGNELVSIDDRSTAATPQYYVVSDHQGSYASIENGASPGTNFVSESFTAFGNRRNGETWSGAPTATDESNINIVSRRGFTGESMLGTSMGLNHLNGRVEDAITGRFLSPDPTIPNPGDTQSFNRYSYVNNRPLTMVDPSGFTPEKGACNPYCPGDYDWAGAASGTNGGSAFGDASGDDGFDDVFGASAADLITGAWGFSPGSSLGSDSGHSSSGPGVGNDPGASASGGGSSSTDPTSSGTVATDTAGSGTTTVSSGSAQSGAPNLSMAPSEDGTPALLSQGTAAQSQQGFGSNPGFAASSIDELSEIQVTAAAGYDQSALHNLIVAQMTAAFRKAGATVVNGPVLCLPGVTPCGQPDLLVGVGGFKRLFAVEVKTGSLYDLTAGQVNIYPHLPGGGSLVAGDSSLTQFGIFPGQSLPPIPLMFYVQGVINGQGYWIPGFVPQQ